MSAAELRNFTLRRSFKEELNKHFPPHVHASILAMGVSTVEDAYFMVMEDLIKSPTISVLQARKVHSLLQHHQVHHSYPDKIQPIMPFRPNHSTVPLKSKQAKDLPTFSGDLADWMVWKEKAIGILGHNQWLAVANHRTITEDTEFHSINNALYWAILQAVNFGQVHHRVREHEASAFGHPNGNGAWNSLIAWFETTESNELMALSIEKALHEIKYTEDDAQTIGGFIDKFNGLIYQHTKYVGAVSYPPDRQLRMFTMAIETATPFASILDIAFTQKWDIQTLQANLRIKEVRLNPHNFSDLTKVVQRRQPLPHTTRHDVRNQPEKLVIPSEYHLPFPIWKACNTHADYTKYCTLVKGEKYTEAKAIKAALIKAYEAKVKVRRSELQNDAINIDDMLGQIDDLHMGPMEEQDTIPLFNDNNPQLDFYPDIVPAPLPNYTPITAADVINRRGKVKNRQNQSYIVTDSGAEMVTLGSGWLITKRGDMPSINIAGPCQQMGKVNMYRGSGITRVNSTTHGPVLLRAANNALIYPEQIRHVEQETLFSHSQLREHGVIVEDCPQKYGGGLNALC